MLLFALGCILAGGLPAPAEAARRATPARQTILVFGDSLSDGFGLARNQAYPALLAQKAESAGYNVEVINASASGGTTAGGLQRLSKHLGRRIDILVLELGINDAFRGIPLDRIRENLQAIIDRVKGRNPNVRLVVAGMQLPIFAADDYMQGFGEIYAELAKKNRAALVPYLLEGVGGDPVLNLPDRLHPNAAGQRILAENVWRVLDPLLRAATGASAGSGQGVFPPP